MVKTKIVETIEEHNENGELVKRTITENEEIDDTPIRYLYSPAGPYDDLTFKEYLKIAF